MPCMASFFDAMSGVKNLLNFIPAITCPISAFEASIVLPTDLKWRDESISTLGGIQLTAFKKVQNDVTCVPIVMLTIDKDN